MYDLDTTIAEVAPSGFSKNCEFYVKEIIHLSIWFYRANYSRDPWYPNVAGEDLSTTLLRNMEPSKVEELMGKVNGIHQEHDVGVEEIIEDIKHVDLMIDNIELLKAFNIITDRIFLSY